MLKVSTIKITKIFKINLLTEFWSLGSNYASEMLVVTKNIKVIIKDCSSNDEIVHVMMMRELKASSETDQKF